MRTEENRRGQSTVTEEHYRHAGRKVRAEIASSYTVVFSETESRDEFLKQ